MTLILVLVYYGSGCIGETQNNAIDRGTLRIIWKIFKKRRRPSLIWEETIRKAVLMFSDQQLVTGLAILGSALAQLNRGISSYHWQIIVYLAWFSSFTHLSLLTVLRAYFHEHAGIRNWRLALMTATIALLTAVLIPTGVSRWQYSSLLGVPAICYFYKLKTKNAFNFEFGSTEAISMLVSIFILIFSSLTRAIKLSTAASALSKRFVDKICFDWLRILLDRLKRQMHKTRYANFWKLLYLLVLTIYWNLKMIEDLYTSVIAEVGPAIGFQIVYSSQSR